MRHKIRCQEDIMKYLKTSPVPAVLISGLLYLADPIAAFSQNNPSFIEGTIVSMDKAGFVLKLSDSSQKKILINDETRIVRRMTASISEIRAGEALGVTSVPGSENTMIAKAITIFPSGFIARIRNGQFPMSDPGNTMTNAEVIRFSDGMDGKVLKMNITEGVPDIQVPDGTPVMRMILLKRQQLKVNASVRIRGQFQPDGSVAAEFVEIVK